jgi:dihydrofolate synthase / folylpolyglutamate synthase
VQVAVVEAGLGGRYDATAVIDSRLTALTNVGLEHTRWLGPTLVDIATEKLAVLGEDSILAVGDRLPVEVLDVARARATQQRARLLIADDAPVELEIGARGAFQRSNFALARVAAEAYLGHAKIEMREQAVHAAALSTSVPGRMQVVARDPLTVVDGAHNPAATVALVESLPELLAGRRLALVLGVLEDKDAAQMLAALLPLCERAWFTAPPSQRALPPATLLSLARQLGFEQAVCEPRPASALAAAQSWARTLGGDGAVLASGSVYLVGDLLANASELGLDTGLQRSSERDERSQGTRGRGGA